MSGENTTGVIIRGYQIVDRIKDGSVGTVWRARNRLGEYVALKQISERNAQLARKRRRFRHEALLTAQLNHPHIIRVYDFVETQPRPFFVMEYFESENLKYAMFNRPERVYTNEFRILRQIAHALAYTHSKGIIHKDLKPENVLVSPAGDVRLIDFSLAQTKWQRFFQLGRRMEGTPAYMAPEQVLGEKCDERTDIYAFGVLMFELLTKHLPFTAGTEKALLEKQVREPAPFMRTYVSTIAADLDDLSRRLLAKRRKDRIQDITFVLNELSKWERKDTHIRQLQVEPAKPLNG
jgi:serine/threonine protein kinase